MLRTSALFAALGLAVVGFGGAAQAQSYPAQPYPQPYQAQYYPAPPAYYQPPQTPPSWSYDPYTSRSGPCPEGVPGDLTACQSRPNPPAVPRQ